MSQNNNDFARILYHPPSLWEKTKYSIFRLFINLRTFKMTSKEKALYAFKYPNMHSKPKWTETVIKHKE